MNARDYSNKDPLLLLGTLDTDSQAYLFELNQSAPVRFYQAPKVYLSNPYSERIDLDRIGLVDGFHTTLTFNSHRALYNDHTGRTELNMTCICPDRELFPFKDNVYDADFKPYFTWMSDPNQSRSSRSFVVSLANSMASDLRPLRVQISVVDSSDPSYQVFNRASSHGGGHLFPNI